MRHFFDKDITQNCWWTGLTIVLLCAGFEPIRAGHLTRAQMLFGSLGAMIWLVAVARIFVDAVCTVAPWLKDAGYAAVGKLTWRPKA